MKRSLLGAWLLMTACSGQSNEELRGERDGTIDGELLDGATVAETDSGPGDASEPEGSEGDAGLDSAVDAGPLPGLYVDPAFGRDANSGTPDAPFKTIAHAASVAQAGETIRLLPGNYDTSSEPAFSTLAGISIPDGVSLAASPGTATLSGDARALLLLGSSEISGLTFKRFRTSLAASTGEVQIRDTTFDGTGTDSIVAPIVASGDVKLLVIAGSVQTVYQNGYNSFLRLSNSAQARIVGGSYAGASAVGCTLAVFMATDMSTLSIENVTVSAVENNVVFTSKTASALITGSTFADSSYSPNGGVSDCTGAVIMADSSSVVIRDSEIRETSGPAVRGFSLSPVNITIDNSRLHFGKSHAISFDGVPNSVTITGSELSDNTGTGVRMGGGGSLTIRDSQLSRNGNYGLYFNGPGSILVRGSTLADNALGGAFAFVTVAPVSNDFGTLSSPGGNTFTGNAPTTGGAGLYVFGAGSALVHAFENTWNPGVQQADALGHYGSSVLTTVNGPLGLIMKGNYAIQQTTVLEL